MVATGHPVQEAETTWVRPLLCLENESRSSRARHLGTSLGNRFQLSPAEQLTPLAQVSETCLSLSRHRMGTTECRQMRLGGLPCHNSNSFCAQTASSRHLCCTAEGISLCASSSCKLKLQACRALHFCSSAVLSESSLCPYLCGLLILLLTTCALRTNEANLNARTLVEI